MKKQTSPKTPDDSSHQRVERLLGALNSATLAMQKAMTHNDIFSIMGTELRKLGMSCIVFPYDSDQKKIFTRYLSVDPELLAHIEKNFSIKIDGFSLPVKKEKIFKKTLVDKQTVYFNNSVDIACQIMPEFEQKHNEQVIEGLKNQRVIVSPIIVSDKVIGLLSVQSNDLETKDVPLIMALSHQFAAAWNKVELLQDLEKELADREEVENALKQSEEHFRSVYENTTIGLYRITPEGRILMANPTLITMLGYSSFEELTQRNLGEEGFELNYPRSDFIQEIESEGQVIGKDSVWKRNDGTQLVVRESAKAIRDDKGNTLYYEGTVEDITVWKQTQEALLKSEEKYRNILENMQEGYFEVDLEGRFTFINETISRVTGVPKGEILGWSFRKFVERKDVTQVIQAFNHVYRTGESLNLIEWEITTKAGVKLIIEASASLMKNTAGERIGFYGILRDITEKKQEEHLQIALYDIAQAADLSPTLEDLYKEIHRIIQSVMPAENFYIALYHESEDLISYPYFVDEFEDTPTPHKSARGTTEYVLRTGKSLLCDLDFLEELERTGEANLVGPPSPIWLGVPLIVEGKTIGVMVVQHYSDVNAYGEREKRMLEFVSTQVAHAIETKQKEKALRESESKLAKAQKIAQLGHWENNLVTGEIYWSDELFNLYKYPKELGLPIKYYKDALNLLHPEDRPDAIHLLEDTLAGHGEYKMDRRIICMDGEIRWTHVDGEIEFDENGKPIRLFGTTQDITERKKAEEALRQAEAETRSRLAEQTRLRKAISIISSTLDLPTVLNHIVGEMCEAIDASSAYICSIDMETNESTVIAEYFSQHASSKERISDIGKKFVESDVRFMEYLIAGKPWIDHIDDLNLSEQEREELIKFGGKSTLTIPLRVAGEFSSYIELWESRQRREFTPEQVALCQDIAQYAAVALNNASLFAVARNEIEERKQAEDKYRQLVDNSLVGIYIMQDGLIQFCNQRYADMYGYQTPEEMIGMRVEDLIAPESKNRYYEEVEARESGEKEFSHYELKLIKKDLTTFDIEVWATQIMFQDKPATQGAILDISERVESERRLEYLATHDVMTNLPNRLLFHDRLSHALDIAMRNQWNGAIFFLDLDDFKLINDAYKHEFGDQLLRMVAARLRSFTRRSDTVSRFGGDEFAVLLENIADPANIEPIAEKVLRGLAEPYTIDQIPLFISASMGISVFPKDGDTISQLLQNADIAMYQAKRIGNTYKFFSQEMSDEIIDSIELGNFLREAVWDKHLILNYQPQYNILSGEVVGFEVLLRLSHPEMEIIPPRRFIPIAEKNGMIVPIGEWVLEQACRGAYKLSRKMRKTFRIAVNISAVQIKQPDFVDTVSKILKKTKFAPHCLELEITENSIFSNLEEVNQVMQDLKTLGVRLAMDDFGRGYSSLSYLASFPLSTIKVDSSFVKNVESTGDIAVIEGIVTIANNLDLDLIIEGVETQTQLDAFRSKGCEIFQGWYFSKDVSESELAAKLKEGVPSLRRMDTT